MKRRTFTPSAAQKAASREKRNALVARSVPIQIARKSGRLPWAELPTVNACLELIYTRESGQTEFRTFQGWKADGFSVEKGATGFAIWGKPLTARAEGSDPAPDTFTTPAESEAAHGFSFFPICYLFSAAQVRDAAGNRPASYRPEPVAVEDEGCGCGFMHSGLCDDGPEPEQPADERAAEIVIASPAMLADAIAETHALNEGHACARCHSTAHDGLNTAGLCFDCDEAELHPVPQLQLFA